MQTLNLASFGNLKDNHNHHSNGLKNKVLEILDQSHNAKFSIGISHIGNVMFSSPMKLIHLNHVLHTPQISKQLTNVTKLCSDNQAFVESYPSHFLEYLKIDSTKLLHHSTLHNLLLPPFHQIHLQSLLLNYPPPLLKLSSLSKIMLYNGTID
ncbi:hypothetical protein AAG906_033154 [Vitis piasezkii]